MQNKFTDWTRQQKQNNSSKTRRGKASENIIKLRYFVGWVWKTHLHRTMCIRWILWCSHSSFSLFKKQAPYFAKTLHTNTVAQWYISLVRKSTYSRGRLRKGDWMTLHSWKYHYTWLKRTLTFGCWEQWPITVEEGKVFEVMSKPLLYNDISSVDHLLKRNKRLQRADDSLRTHHKG